MMRWVRGNQTQLIKQLVNQSISHSVTLSISSSISSFLLSFSLLYSRSNPLHQIQSHNRSFSTSANHAIRQSTNQSVTNQTVRSTMFDPSLPSPCPVWPVTQSINETSSQSSNQLHDQLQPACEALQAGGLVAIPTETVYGLAANAYDSQAISKVYQSKGRPSDNPLIVHVANTDQVISLVQSLNHTEMKLAQAFWPGPLTMVLKPKLHDQTNNQSNNHSDNQSNNQSFISQSDGQTVARLPPGTLSTGVLSKSGTVAVRVPAHPIARALINQSGLPLAAPSANTSGRPSPTTAQHVLEDLGSGRGLSGIVDGGATGVGLESTVVQVDENERVHILRPGGVTKEMIEQLLGRTINQAVKQSINSDSHEAPVAPGMKYAHYAPKADVTLIDGSQQYCVQSITRWINQANNQSHNQPNSAVNRVGVLTFHSQRDAIERLLNDSIRQSDNPQVAFIVRALGSSDSISDVAAALFGSLRAFDHENVDAIFAPVFDRSGLGEAVMNRLTKAAAGRIWKEQYFVNVE